MLCSLIMNVSVEPITEERHCILHVFYSPQLWGENSALSAVKRPPYYHFILNSIDYCSVQWFIIAVGPRIGYNSLISIRSYEGNVKQNETGDLSV